ncbi:nibrin isoform X3 [Ammospiza nelsoni]|uniref:nibrin isoform X3 n=1 Tax=Ammospiza caudacuta TaxID=2857398 RepID=UPI0027385F61|nr:nibrin isoform X3 [Ammospiza caudacuta]XP_059321963.1 nibrin isoform X3 [Ammospiza nelsoni]
MWKLVPASGKGEPYRLLSGVEYVVGRRSCTILIQDDQSISRSHAVLTVSRPETSPSQSLTVPVLTVRDTSKYGTFVNGSKLNGASVSLQSGDRINFGVFESKFRVEYEPLVVCSSCLDVAQKNALNQAIQQLGGLVVNEWTKECTHLVMVSVKVTVKTICALICARPIIKPEFFSELIRAVQSRQQLPNHVSFYPPVDEPSIGSENLDLSEHHERKKIFSGKTFVFLTAKQHKKLGPAVVLGGGEVKLMTEGRKEMPLLLSPEVCVVDVGLANSQISGSDSMTNWTDSILTDLESKNLRAIPEAEIGLAVIFMSTEKYCNPQKQPVSKAVPESSAVVGQAISQSVAVDETIMPTAAHSSTLYIADTEEQTCMEIENTSQLHRQRKMAFQDTTGKKNSGTSGSVNAGTSMPRGSRTSGFSQRSQPVSPSKIPEAGKTRESASCHPNSITNYFQVSRKRERAEEEETSVPKIAKLEERSSPFPKSTESTTSLMCNSEAKQHQKKNNILDPNPNFAEDRGMKPMRESVKLTSDRTDTKTSSRENHAPKKRKELDDLSEDTKALEIVFGSGDIDWEDQMADHDQEAQRSKRKKQCLEAKGSRIPEVTVNQQEENKVLNHSKLQDESSNLPSRLLLTEFRSLVVSHPRQNSHLPGNNSYGGKKNFKMFKKVAYPGAGQLPHIIGGSDLIAHHAKKNSELEDWLRQEMEEQNRQAREESLADDLFRYDPNVKRRR